MEQGLHSQMIRIRRKDLNFVATDKNNIEAKFKFQGQSARSQRWFDLDFDWIEGNFSICEPDFYKKTFQSHDDSQDNNTFKSFQVTIVNAKFVESFKFLNDAPILKYCQKSLNSCCFNSLVSSFADINHNNSANAISMRIEESLNSEVGHCIDFSNDILKNNKRNIGEAKVCYKMIKYMKKGLYKISQ